MTRQTMAELVRERNEIALRWPIPLPGKQCAKCHRRLDVELFPRNRKLSDGLSSWCRECHAEATRAWRAKQRA